MQRVTNCILVDEHDRVLLLKKPSRGWWVAPGGKMESGETIKESVDREFREETGLFLQDAELKAVSSMVIFEDEQIVSEWMLFTFKAGSATGEQLAHSPEGQLGWKNTSEVLSLPMAEGDRHVLAHLLNRDEGVLYATFHYTSDFKLLSYRLDPEPTNRC